MKINKEVKLAREIIKLMSSHLKIEDEEWLELQLINIIRYYKCRR